MQAQKTVAELQIALLNYHAEYKRFPQLAPNSDGDIPTDTWNSELIEALIAVPDRVGIKKHNERGVKFFQARSARGANSPGLWLTAEGRYRLNDSWGNPYQIVLDANGDGEIEVLSQAGDGSFEIFTDSVAVWSYGRNGRPGKGGGKRNDDIYAF